LNCISKNAGAKEAELTNPFEDENGVYHVLVNEEGQHSLWPSFIDVPVGWTIIHASDTRAACLEFINQNWTDMRPRSLIERMKNEPSPSEQAKQDARSAVIGPRDVGGDPRTVH
jgi:MbtH protein